jgi:phage terminase large subunit
MSASVKDKLKYLELLRVKSRLAMPLKMKAFLNKCRYKFAWGGRGGGKSKSICKILLEKGNKQKIRVLCLREIQTSIDESVYSDLKETAIELGYTNYEFKNNQITNAKTGTVFKFQGLYLQDKKQSIKSYSNFDIFWIEEAQSVSDGSLQILIPTIRKEGSEIWFSFNRLLPDDPVWKLKHKIKPENKIEVLINIDDNPFVSKELIDEYNNDKDLYEAGLNDEFLHVWKGEPFAYSDKTLLKTTDLMPAINRKADTTGGYVVGVDVARFGKDLTVFFMRKGLKIIKWESYPKTSVDQVCDYLVNFVNNDTSIPLRIDDTGVGGGVTDFMKRFGFKAIPVNNGSSANDKNKYTNKISEMWFYLKSIINDISIPDISDLKTQLLTREWDIENKTRRRFIESKKEYIKRTKMKSPDYADALLLCFADIKEKRHHFTRGIM